MHISLTGELETQHPDNFCIQVNSTEQVKNNVTNLSLNKLDLKTADVRYKERVRKTHFINFALEQIEL